MKTELAIAVLVVVTSGCAQAPTLKQGRDFEMGELAGLPAGTPEETVIDQYGPPQRVAVGEDGSRILTYFYIETTATGHGPDVQIVPVFTRSACISFVDGGSVEGIGYHHSHYSRLDMNQDQRHLLYLENVEKFKACAQPMRNAEGEILVDIDAVKYPITGVLETLSQETGLDIEPEPADLAGEVTLTSVREPWQNVLDSAAKQAGCMIRKESSRYVVSKAESPQVDGDRALEEARGD